MPQEFFPRNEVVIYQPKIFSWLNTFLDYAEKFNLSEQLVSEVLGDWPMPNDPVRSEN